MKSVKGGDSADFELLETGLYPARCSVIAGIGEQDSQYGPKQQCVLTFTLFLDNGEHRTQSGFYTLSLGSSTKPSNLRKLLEGWRGRPFTAEEEAAFDLETVLGKPCQIIIKHKAKKDGTMASVIDSCVKAKGTVPNLPEDPIWYSAWGHDERAFQLLPEWIQKKVNRPNGGTQDEYGQEPTAEELAGTLSNFDPDGDIVPF